ncbi:MAG: Sec-independent protein translocase subunit TatA/TatB [Pirellulales bacterium]|jgi:sec-independent protein translocase protein TatA
MSRLYCTPSPGIRQTSASPDRKVTIMLGFMGLGTVELIVVAVVILLLFGARLPRVMRSLGEGIVEFKRGINAGDDEPRLGSPGSSTATDSRPTE